MFHLDGDWDRDGKITGTPAERSARTAAPGLIVLANLDVDARRLPASVKPENTQTPDAEQASVPKGDDDARTLRVVAEPAAPGGPFTLSLLIPATAEQTFRLSTAAGTRIAGRKGGPLVRFPVPTATSGKPASVLLEARLLPGSPIAAAAGASIELEWIDATGRVGKESGLVSVAPLVLVGDLATPERLYMCVDEGENDPSVTEVRAACGLARVPFVPVPASVHAGDTWLQDQFQIGYCQGPDQLMRVLLHLPRVRNDFVLGQLAPNLAGLVEGHFPSTGLGVCTDFWKRSVKVTDITGTVRDLPFADTGELLYKVVGVGAVFSQVFFQLALLGAPFTGAMPTTFSAARRALPRALAELRSAVAKAKSGAAPRRVAALDARLKTLDTLVNAVIKAMPIVGGGISLPVGGQAVVLSFSEADLFATKLEVLHDSLNYGGNIEVGPAGASTPHGKIVIGEEPAGTSTTGQPREIDPQLFAFLTAQGTQPIVKIDTSWLDVGHVDELISFVPDRQSANGTAILRASPRIALTILRELRARFIAGGPLDPPLWENYVYLGMQPRHTTSGSFPVTHLLRGKLWRHEHRTGDASASEPPRIYRRLAEADEKEPMSTHRIDYEVGMNTSRTYPAGISVFELLKFEGGTNDDIEKTRLAGVDKVLAAEFPGSRLLEVPVLFDQSDDLNTTRTSAFTPDLVNLQVLGRVLVMPRSYGPRVPLPAAANVLRAVLPDAVKSRATTDVLVGKGLDVTVHWAKFGHDIAFAETFADGFPGVPTTEVAKRIRKANPAHFLNDGRLRDGWRRLIIPERTVDLFQAYTTLVLEPLGVTVAWVDSWSYHVRFGGIHCGTNVLRTPAPPAVPWWRTRTAPAG
ncbi:protein-arginine deiminase family protein [Actinophytocola sp. KF-1]